jgi:tetraacyldisaccharide 4'-kinase
VDWETLHRRMTSQDRGPWWLSGLRGIASGLSVLYGLGANLKNLGYDLGLFQPKRLSAPVIGVGNLAVGGTGKTPLVMALVQALQRLGLPAAIVSRGYGGVGATATKGVTWVSRDGEILVGADVAGDEPLLLARRLNIPVAVGPERFVVGDAILTELGARVLVGDDLFQHRQLHRDMDIVCLDAADPLAGGLLPRGRLREPISGLRRAHAVVLTRAIDPEATAHARAWLRSFWGNGPVLTCRHKIGGLIRHQGNAVGPGELKGRPVLAFCGLARPDSFKAGLEEFGFQVHGLEAFPDHYPFAMEDVARLWRKAADMGAAALVCSEKDQVRLPAGLPPEMEIWVTQLELDFDHGPNVLENLLAWGLKRWEARA